MRLKPPFHAQETPDSCIPACLRMLLAAAGVQATEAEIRARCDCSPVFGTSALSAVRAARDFGFPLTAKDNLLLMELQTLVEDGHFPICYVNAGPLDGYEGQQAVIVVELSDASATVLDPLHGERLISLDSFRAAWGLQRNLTILLLR
ncbi:MAG: cysteine peptidase family C39 domain-containing protein [Blastocatellia bacterium]